MINPGVRVLMEIFPLQTDHRSFLVPIYKTNSNIRKYQKLIKTG